MAVGRSILSAIKPKIKATIAANPHSTNVVIENAVARSSGGTTAAIIGSFAPLPGQLISNPIKKQKPVNWAILQSLVEVIKMIVKGMPKMTES